MAIIERIPRTNIRQKHLIKVFSLPTNEAFDLNSVDFTALISRLNTSTPIGGIQELSIETSRELYDWRELNYDTLGRIMEVYPSLGEFKVTVGKVALYTEHMLDAFKAVDKDVFAGSSDSNPLNASYNVYNQISPLFLLVDVLTPTNTTGAGAFETSQNISVLLYDCWFDKSNLEFDVTDDDLKMLQDAELTCAGIYTVKAS
jgi:hypothetical protein